MICRQSNFRQKKRYRRTGQITVFSFFSKILRSDDWRHGHHEKYSPYKLDCHKRLRIELISSRCVPLIASWFSETSQIFIRYGSVSIKCGGDLASQDYHRHRLVEFHGRSYERQCISAKDGDAWPYLDACVSI